MDLSQIIDNRLYLGTLKREANPKTRQYWLTIEKNIVIINPEIIQEQLERARQKVLQARKEWKEIIVLSDKLVYKDDIENICESKGVHYFSYKVPSGVITNFETLRQNINKMNELRKFIESEDFLKLTKKEQQVKKRQLKKIENIYKWVKNLEKRPELVIVVDGMFLSKFVNEVEKTGVEWIIMASTDFNRWLDDKLLMMNVNWPKSVPAVLRYLLD